jgi:hypothetical protein
MGIPRATTERQTDSEENSDIQPKENTKLRELTVKMRDQHTLEEDGTGHSYPNP